MNMKKILLGSLVAASMGVAAPAMAFEKGVSISADGGSHHSWGSTISVNGDVNSVSLSRYAVGSDSVTTVDYKHQITPVESPLRMTFGLSGMKSDYSEYEFGEKDYEAGYALGVSVGFGYDIFSSGTSIDMSLTEAVSETRFNDGQVFDAGITQRMAENMSVKVGFRQIDREVNGEVDQLLETGYVGLKFNF